MAYVFLTFLLARVEPVLALPARFAVAACDSLQTKCTVVSQSRVIEEYSTQAALRRRASKSVDRHLMAGAWAATLASGTAALSLLSNAIKMQDAKEYGKKAEVQEKRKGQDQETARMSSLPLRDVVLANHQKISRAPLVPFQDRRRRCAMSSRTKECEQTDSDSDSDSDDRQSRVRDRIRKRELRKSINTVETAIGTKAEDFARYTQELAVSTRIR